jgi:hypothetical protein
VGVSDNQPLDGFLASVGGKFSLSPAISADKHGLHANVAAQKRIHEDLARTRAKRAESTDAVSENALDKPLYMRAISNERHKAGTKFGRLQSGRVEFEMAYQTRVAIDRIRFAIKPRRAVWTAHGPNA